MTTMAILYPGALGGPVARLLSGRGVDLVTDVGGRSRRTRANALAAGMRLADGLRDAVAGSGIILSLVPPAQAVGMAQRCAEAAGGFPSTPRRLYVDANSISPPKLETVAGIVSAAGMDCVDAAVIGPAAMLGDGTFFVLSGPRAGEVAALLNGSADAMVVGAKPGDASALKMSVGLITKALAALGLEMYGLSARLGQTDALSAVLHRMYPETLEFLARNLTTFQRHGPRRVDEMRDLEDWMRASGEEPVMADAARRVVERLSRAGPSSDRIRSFHEILAALAAEPGGPSPDAVEARRWTNGNATGATGTGGRR
ncbi:MAG TPA: DUF1932 domain-containing protein [Arenibaculum sp.]|nr:DUF1932 domain-containing protein [Arenibaculum sp.]